MRHPCPCVACRAEDVLDAEAFAPDVPPAMLGRLGPAGQTLIFGCAFLAVRTTLHSYRSATAEVSHPVSNSEFVVPKVRVASDRTAAPDPSPWLPAGLHPGQPHAEPLQPFHDRVVFTLIRAGYDALDYRFFAQRCACLRKQLKSGFDDVAFHEGNLDNATAARLTAQFGVRFVDVRLYGGFTVPPTVSMPALRGPGEYPIGYKHMCRFFSMQWFHALRRYKIAMRIDEDVCVHNTDGDPFEKLEGAADLRMG